MVARDRIPSDPTISKHVVHRSSSAEPSGTRYSGQINEDMHQADLCHGVRRILGPNPLYSKLGLQPPHYRPSPAARPTGTRPADQGRGIKTHSTAPSAGSHRSAWSRKKDIVAASTRGLHPGRRARQEVLAPPQPRLNVVAVICPQLLRRWDPPPAAASIYTGERSFWWRLGLALTN
jgi:hypothetical protein